MCGGFLWFFRGYISFPSEFVMFLKRNDCFIKVLNLLSLVLFTSCVRRISTACFVQAVVRMDVFFSETENSHDNQLTL